MKFLKNVKKKKKKWKFANKKKNPILNSRKISKFRFFFFEFLVFRIKKLLYICPNNMSFLQPQKTTYRFDQTSWANLLSYDMSFLHRRKTACRFVQMTTTDLYENRHVVFARNSKNDMSYNAVYKLQKYLSLNHFATRRSISQPGLNSIICTPK